MKILCLYFFVTPVIIQFPCILINSFRCLNSFSKYQSISLAALEDAWSEVWSVTVWWNLPHSPDIYLLRTPDSSNFFRFPLKVRVIGSRMHSINCALVFEVFEGNSNIFILKRCLFSIGPKWYRLSFDTSLYGFWSLQKNLLKRIFSLVQLTLSS